MATKMFTEIISKRRSIYGLGAESPVSDQEIIALVQEVIRQVPSAFNCQSQKAVLLLGEKHLQFWQMAREALRKIVKTAKFPATEAKIDSFAAGRGTVLFFDDTVVTAQLGENFPTYRDNFPVWAGHANGMLQFALWCQFAEVGLGASLQHYSELVHEQVREAFDLPASWQLLAQMPFGNIVAPPEEKDFLPIEERLRVFA